MLKNSSTLAVSIPLSLSIKLGSVAVAWSVESLPFNPGARVRFPAARVRFPAGSGILISVLGLGVCPLSVLCPVLSSAEALTFDHTFREARPCVYV